MYYVGVDIGGKNVKMGIGDDFGKILSSMTYKTLPERGYDAILLEIIANINNLCEEAGLYMDDISGIGIGVPGICNSRVGLVMSCSNLNWKGVELANDIKNLTNKPCKVCNDANCAALGEQRFGSGRNYKNLVFITLGTGIGSGIIIDGKLFEGLGCAGAEAGHMGICVDGLQCDCGNKGCWESYASSSRTEKPRQHFGRGMQGWYKRKICFYRSKTRRQNSKKTHRKIYRLCHLRTYRSYKHTPSSGIYRGRRYCQRRCSFDFARQEKTQRIYRQQRFLSLCRCSRCQARKQCRIFGCCGFGNVGELCGIN